MVRPPFLQCKDTTFFRRMQIGIFSRSAQFCEILRQSAIGFLLLLSGKICLFILENTNFTNNTNRWSRKSISMRDEYFLIRGE